MTSFSRVLLLLLCLAAFSSVTAQDEGSTPMNAIAVSTDVEGGEDVTTLDLVQENYVEHNPAGPDRVEQTQTVDVNMALDGASNSEIRSTQASTNTVQTTGGGDTVTTTNHGTIDVTRTNGEGDDEINAAASTELVASTGADDDTVSTDTGLSITVNGAGTGGHDTIAAETTTDVMLDTGSGDDTVSLTNSSEVNYNGDPSGIGSLRNQAGMTVDIDTGEGNDSVTLDNVARTTVNGVTESGEASMNGNVNLGDGDDEVEVGGSNNSGDISFDGGAGRDRLVMNFHGGSVTQDRADEIAGYLSANTAAGSLNINGALYSWQNFEELVNLIRFAILTDSDGKIELRAAITDGRLNAQDLAAPVAVYCTINGFEVWAIDPNTGDGTLDLVATLAALNAHGNVSGTASSVLLLANGQLQVTAYGGYSFTFEPGGCLLP